MQHSSVLSVPRRALRDRRVPRLCSWVPSYCAHLLCPRTPPNANCSGPETLSWSNGTMNREGWPVVLDSCVLSPCVTRFVPRRRENLLVLEAQLTRLFFCWRRVPGRVRVRSWCQRSCFCGFWRFLVLEVGFFWQDSFFSNLGMGQFHDVPHWNSLKLCCVEREQQGTQFYTRRFRQFKNFNAAGVRIYALPSEFRSTAEQLEWTLWVKCERCASMPWFSHRRRGFRCGFIPCEDWFPMVVSRKH